VALQDEQAKTTDLPAGGIRIDAPIDDMKLGGGVNPGHGHAHHDPGQKVPEHQHDPKHDAGQDHGHKHCHRLATS
jgi:hypothetical protein